MLVRAEPCPKCYLFFRMSYKKKYLKLLIWYGSNGKVEWGVMNGWSLPEGGVTTYFHGYSNFLFHKCLISPFSEFWLNMKLFSSFKYIITLLIWKDMWMGDI